MALFSDNPFNHGKNLSPTSAYHKLAEEKDKDDIHIKKSHEGLFTAKAEKAGMSVQAYADKVLADPDADPDTKKQANFAKNASGWHKGMTKEDVEQIDELSKSTLSSYAKKATKNSRIMFGLGKDFQSQASRSRKGSNKDAGSKLADKYKDMARKREANVGKAIDRLAKEDTDLNEIVGWSQAPNRNAAPRRRTSAGSLGQMAAAHSNKKPQAAGAQAQAGKKPHNPNWFREDKEALTEISKQVLGSYIKKASTDVHNRAHRAGEAWGKRDIASGTPHLIKSINRQHNIRKATDRLTKEDVDNQDK